MLFVLSFTGREEIKYFFLLDLDPSGLTGLEPAASALTGRCSDQLNYNPREIKCTTYVVDLISFKPFYVDFLFELSYSTRQRRE